MPTLAEPKISLWKCSNNFRPDDHVDDAALVAELRQLCTDLRTRLTRRRTCQAHVAEALVEETAAAGPDEAAGSWRPERLRARGALPGRPAIVPVGVLD
ncbi:hypothetical protein [Cupriavidus necator]|uniref:hypothetical protein n=1 Tax=Cupriavidus necator TaxID=106590 RepID=UPI003F738F03